MLAHFANPIFIVGAPRSGTTLLRSMLDAHPNICCPLWETGVFEKYAMITNGDITHVLRDDPTFPITRADLLAWCRRSFDDLMTLLTSPSGKSRWAEKTPAHVFHMDLIHEIYPEAQFIHIIRDGRDVVRSLQNMPWAPRNIAWSAHRWVDSVRAGIASGRKIASDQYLELQYEQLVAEPKRQLEVLCAFLHEPFSSQMLAFHKPSNNSWHISQTPLQQQSTSKHRPLSFYERIVFSWICARFRQELGYTN